MRRVRRRVLAVGIGVAAAGGPSAASTMRAVDFDVLANVAACLAATSGSIRT